MKGKAPNSGIFVLPITTAPAARSRRTTSPWPSVSGLSGTGAGLCTLAATFATGDVTDDYSFGPIMVVASLVPLLAVVAVLTLVRNTGGSADGVLGRSESAQQARQHGIDPRRRGLVEIERRRGRACAGSTPARPA